MGRLCTICRLKRRRELERDYVAGVPLVELATRYHVGRDAVRRHLDLHYMEPVEAPIEGDIQIQGLGVLEEQLQRDITRLRELATVAANAGDLRQAGHLLGLCIQGHTALLTSRDRRLGHNARLWSRVLANWKDAWGSQEQFQELVRVLASGAFQSGNVQVDFDKRP